MLLLAGLGNPGSGYARNRHNIGFMAVDEIVHRHSLGPFRKSRFHGELAEGKIGTTKVLVLKPATYMNELGRAIQSVMSFHKIAPEDVLVFHDELDLAAGKVRIKRSGGHGGHNGIRSIHAQIGDVYGRVRLGIGHPGTKDKVVGHVLKDFAKSDQDWLDKLLPVVADEVKSLVDGDDAGFMSRVALVMNPPKPKPAQKQNTADMPKESKETH